MPKAKYIAVLVKDVQYPGQPARWQQFVDIHTDEIIDQRLLQGWKVEDAFTDTFGRMVITFENPY